MSRPKRRFSWVLLHLIAFGVTILCMFTGLRIAAVSRPELLVISSLLPQGYLHELHLIGGFGLIAVTIAYLLLLTKDNKKSFPSGHFHHRVTQYGYGVCLALIASGVTLLLGHYATLQLFHFYAAVAFVAYLFLHAILIFIQYGVASFSRIFITTKAKILDAIVLVIGAVAFTLFLLIFPSLGDKTLYARAIAIEEMIEIDGQADEAVWKLAKEVHVLTHGGENFENGSTPVKLKALHNEQELFLFITWQDKTESLQHMPLMKTENGWKVKEEGFYYFDEKRHYEDKFAVMLSNNCESGAGKSIGLGPKPLADKPPNWHGKGFHYTTDGSIRDVWHWKAVRTNDMFLADDNFFGPPLQTQAGERRYKAGYATDGKESGAYVMNWQWYQREGIVPKRLPHQSEKRKHYQQHLANLSVAPWYDMDSYDPQKDDFPIGTEAPSVLHRSNRFEGDRADVRARGVWRDGVWSLELVRPLNTGSPYDIPISDGVCLWVSAFDASQTAHTRHVRPLRFSGEDL